jgi:hypothetical protein
VAASVRLICWFFVPLHSARRHIPLSGTAGVSINGFHRKGKFLAVLSAAFQISPRPSSPRRMPRFSALPGSKANFLREDGTDGMGRSQLPAVFRATSACGDLAFGDMRLLWLAHHQNRIGSDA